MEQKLIKQQHVDTECMKDDMLAVAVLAQVDQAIKHHHGVSILETTPLEGVTFCIHTPTLNHSPSQICTCV